MNQKILFEYLKNPKFYGSDITLVQLLQTHISYVALTGKYAYKVKKPVNFGFLDFSSLNKRKYYCKKELRLNRRLCPEIYIGVLPITEKNGKFELNGDGTIVEYAIKMKEFPQEDIMTNMLKQNKITEEIIANITAILIDFYNAQKPSNDIKKYGDLSVVKQNIDENFNQTKPMINITVPKNTYYFIKDAATKFFKQKKEVFLNRIKDNKIFDCHGDLHSGNIVVSDENIYIFDCIEFNDRFRFCDVASDIGFLAMDLDYLNFPYLSSYLIDQYVKKSTDVKIFSVLNFYKSYRAFVRGKVYGFQLMDPYIDTEKKRNVIESAKKYFDLSRYYTRLFSLDLLKKKPLLFLVSGLSGTGKSTIARKIAVDYHAVQINTDVVRKETAGIDLFEQHHDQIDTGLYDPKKIDDTYKKVMNQAEKVLKKGENVVLDATFQKIKYRAMAHHIAVKNHSTVITLQCVCPDDIIKKRLENRLKKKSISDGRWEIYLAQKTTFEPYASDEKCLTIDTSNESYEYRMDFFEQLLSYVYDVK